MTTAPSSIVDGRFSVKTAAADESFAGIDLEDEELLALMPGSYLELRYAVPLSALLKLSLALGGLTVDFPRRPTTWLVSIVGEKVARALCETFRGGRWKVPKAHALRTALRNREILRALEKGVSGRALVMKYGLSERTIQTIRNRAKGATR